MSAPPRSTDERPLNAKEMQEVIRYWLAALRHEEALSMRPRAVPPRKGPHRVDLMQPGFGQTYFKLIDAAGETRCARFLLQADSTLTLPVEAERSAVFERWLRSTYRRERNEALGFVQDEREAFYVGGFPTLYFTRGGELTTLLRARLASPSWLNAEGGPWMPPGYRARQMRALPPPPAQLRLVHRPPASASEDDEVTLPYTLDTQLMQQQLGITDERLDVFMAALEAAAAELEGLEPAAMVAAVTRLVEQDLDEEETLTPQAWLAPLETEPEAAMARLSQAVADRLTGRGGVRCWPMGLVYDGSQGHTTHHLQRDLVALTRRGEMAGSRSALGCYLSGRTPVRRLGEIRGAFRPRLLTADQRLAAERSLGTRFAAVQGPPGTGKTELILDLLADGVVARARRMLDARQAEGRARMSERPVTVVVSTNNRAVDNVIDPLTRDLPSDRLPLALRVGSQEVLATVTVQQLEQTMRWLNAQDLSGAKKQLTRVLDQFEAAWAALDDALEPSRAARLANSRAQEIEDELAALDEQAAADRVLLPALDTPEAVSSMATLLELEDLKPGQLDPLSITEAVVAATERLARLTLARINRFQSRLRGAPAQVVNGFDTRYQKELAEPLDRLTRSMEAFGLSLELSLPPEPEGKLRQRLLAWREALDEALEEIHDRTSQLDEVKAATQRAIKRQDLEAERARHAATPPVEEPAELAELRYAAWIIACRVRERWAITRHRKLVMALDATVEAIRARRLRRFLEEEEEAAGLLARLFPAWGCTLLSLGNVFPPDPGVFHQLIIDEAGQCHPTYAVSGLMRARRALLLGDVNQLEPVVSLTASDELRVRQGSKASLSDARLDPYRVHQDKAGSAQALADRASGEKLVLHAHFRCQPGIIEISDKLCGYGLKVHTPEASRTDVVPELSGPVLLRDVAGQQIRWGGSWQNEHELEVTLRLLRHLGACGLPWEEVAVITPYRGQLDRLRRSLNSAGIPHEDGAMDQELSLFEPVSRGRRGLALGTVHRFQGGERAVVIFSTVVTRPRSLGFLNDRVNLLNVAVSRAREHLVVVGHAETLAQGQYTRLLVDQAAPLVRRGPTRSGPSGR